MTEREVTAATPDPESVHLESFDRLRGYPASYRLEIHGDNFCEYDHGATPYVHAGETNAISYIVDFEKGRIAQACHKCRPANLVWRNFIQDGRLSFTIMEGKKVARECSDSAGASKGEDVIPFLFRFYRDDILFAKEAKQVMVYNKSTGIWQTGTDGNRLLLDLVDQMNKLYQS